MDQYDGFYIKTIVLIHLHIGVLAPTKYIQNISYLGFFTFTLKP